MICCQREESLLRWSYQKSAPMYSESMGLSVRDFRMNWRIMSLRKSSFLEGLRDLTVGSASFTLGNLG